MADEKESKPAGVDVPDGRDKVELGETRKGTHVTPVVQVAPEDAPASPAAIPQNSPDVTSPPESQDGGSASSDG